MKKTIIAVAALGVSVAFADTLSLKSGTVLTGKILGIDGGVVKIATDDLGELSVPTNAVRQNIVSAGAVRHGIEHIEAVPKPLETWHGSINVAYQAAQGNTFENSASIIANLNRRWDNDRFNGDFGYYYSKTGQEGGDAQKTTDRWEVELKHDHFWLPKVYHFEDVRYDRDMIQQLRARYRVGLGGGYQWLEGTEFDTTGKWSFNQELGVNWIKEEYENNDDSKENGYCALRYAHHLTWLPKWVDGMEVFHNAEILPEVDEWEKFLAKVDLGMSTRLFWDFNLLAKLEWDYDSKPANNRKSDDFRFILGLGYKW